MSASKSAFSRRFFASVQRTRFGVPEGAVVDEQKISALGGGALEELQLRAHPGGDRRDLLAPGHLEAVRAVVLEAAGLEQAVELAHDVGQLRCHARRRR